MDDNSSSKIWGHTQWDWQIHNYRGLAQRASDYELWHDRECMQSWTGMPAYHINDYPKFWISEKSDRSIAVHNVVSHCVRSWAPSLCFELYILMSTQRCTILGCDLWYCNLWCCDLWYLHDLDMWSLSDMKRRASIAELECWCSISAPESENASSAQEEKIPYPNLFQGLHTNVPAAETLAARVTPFLRANCTIQGRKST